MTVLPLSFRRYAISGMTLVEIMVVVVILGVIASVLVVNLLPKSESARHHLAKTQLSTIVEHVNLYVVTHRNSLPPSGTGLSVLTSPTAAPSVDYYLKPNQLLDPWGRAFVYRQPGPDGHPFEVVCLGADGQPGGTGVNADISSTQ